MTLTTLVAQGAGRLVPLAVLIAMLLFAAFALNAFTGPPRPVAKPFLTNRERAMLRALEQVLPMYRVHAQVAMGAILKVSPRPGRRPSPADRNAFSQKIIDFVIEDPTTGRIVALVELDDRTHDAERDRRRDAMTGGAGYVTIRIPASARPTVATAVNTVGYLRGAASHLQPVE